MGRFMSATGQFLLATHEQFSRPPTGSSSCPLTTRHRIVDTRGEVHHVVVVGDRPSTMPAT